MLNIDKCNIINNPFNNIQGCAESRRGSKSPNKATGWEGFEQRIDYAWAGYRW